MTSGYKSDAGFLKVGQWPGYTNIRTGHKLTKQAPKPDVG